MQNRDHFRKNIRVLQLRYPDIFQRIALLDYNRSGYRKIITEKGLETLEVMMQDGWILLNSSKDPFQEAKRLVSSSTDGTEQVVAIAGLGMGYQVEELLRRSDQCTIAVLEPSEELFCEILRTRDISHILSSGRVFLFMDPQGVDYSGIAPLPSTSRMKLLLSRPYVIMYGDRMEEFKRGFQAHLNSVQINAATLKRFDRLWTKNTFKNTIYFFSLQGIDTIRESLKGIPAIVVAAGPSLEKDTRLLSLLGKRALLIAVDTALKPLMKRGIAPDFVITVDPQYINIFHLEHIEEMSGGKAMPVLIADPAVYPSILRNYRGEKLLTSSVFPPGRIVEKFSGRKGSISSGGSVATTAFDFARTIGAEPIVLMGLDLSYGMGKTHLSGSFMEEYVHSCSNRLETAGTILSSYIRRGRPSTAKDKTGMQVLTDRRMLLYKSWFEQQIRMTKTQVLNATGGGLTIDGIENIRPEELIHRLPPIPKRKRKIIEGLHRRIQAEAPKDKNISSFLSYLTGIRVNLKRMEVLCRKALVRTKKLAAITPGGIIEAGRRELDRLDSILLSFREENQLLSMVMQSPISEALTRRAGDHEKDGFENSLKLYASMEESLIFLQNLLWGTVYRIKDTCLLT